MSVIKRLMNVYCIMRLGWLNKEGQRKLPLHEGCCMIQFLSLLETLATHVNADNIESFVSLVEKLITLAESVKTGTATQAPTSSPTQSQS